MPLFPGGGTPPNAVPVIGRPIRVTSPEGPWHRVVEALNERGSVMVHALLSDWVPENLDDPELRPVLGRDWHRYQAMRHHHVRERFAASRLLLKHVAAQAIQAPPATVELAYKPGGRPYLRGCDQIDISLSHTEELLLVGITRRGWIGVDAELEDRSMLVSGIERQVCTPYERTMLSQVRESDRNQEMVRLWTLKEAYSKAIGQGMRFRFNEFGFGPSGHPVQVLRPDGSPGTGEEWAFGTCRVEGRYTASWALYDAGFGDTDDTRAGTMLDEGLVTALLHQPSEVPEPAAETTATDTPLTGAGVAA
ncbi:4'-phosphopantetheinyl transferase superfamily protein [Streptomyces sp. H10-C2]|nr:MULTISPECIES: 4'-phosphopantetheinyl transferase superfamily protein [unclassified Streptomyces]MDJ0341803.1 4'-phosphopantetheinyl transferase superfamily protein [Streptomyces sp. PH10-H1]MDJ0370443.1 4'-phosphopantetheinyl transferase superfamily protein [Streptomyces sp. H10-C2]